MDKWCAKSYQKGGCSVMYVNLGLGLSPDYHEVKLTNT